MKLFSLILISVVCCFLSSCEGRDYMVTTFTDKQSYEETGGIAYIGLISYGADTPMMRLNRNEKFKPGEANSFDITIEQDIGIIKKIRIDFNYSNGGKEPDFWFLNSVVLYDQFRHLPQYYACNYWFNATQKKNATRIFKASPESVVDYTVIVETGDQKDAGTHGKVYITLIGSYGNSDKILLDYKGKSEFQRGQADTFFISTADIGDISKIRIELDSTADSHSPNWFLKAVTLIDEERLMLRFPWNQWLTPTLDKKKISVEIPVSTPDGKQ